MWKSFHFVENMTVKDRFFEGLNREFNFNSTGYWNKIKYDNFNCGYGGRLLLSYHATCTEKLAKAHNSGKVVNLVCACR